MEEEGSINSDDYDSLRRHAVQKLFLTIRDLNHTAFCEALEELAELEASFEIVREDGVISIDYPDDFIVETCFSHRCLPNEHLRLAPSQLYHLYPYYNHSLLAYAVRVGSLPIVNELLCRGVSVYPSNRLFGPGGGNMGHPVLIAIREGFLPILEKLISATGMNINLYKPMMPTRSARLKKFRLSETLDFMYRYYYTYGDNKQETPIPADSSDDEDDDEDVVLQPEENAVLADDVTKRCPRANYADLLHYCFHGTIRGRQYSSNADDEAHSSIPKDPIGTGIDCTSFSHILHSREFIKKYIATSRPKSNDEPGEFNEAKYLHYLKRTQIFAKEAFCSSGQQHLGQASMTSVCSLSRECTKEDLYFWLEVAKVYLTNAEVLELTENSPVAQEYLTTILEPCR